MAGFFGKLPGYGDFVERGLSPAFRRNWDGWLTRHIAPRLRGGATFPVDGLMFRLGSGGQTAAGLILPSHDSAGRLFPFSALIQTPGSPDTHAVTSWCQAALPLVQAALTGPVDLDDLWADLDALPFARPTDPADTALLLWLPPGPPQDALANPDILSGLLPFPAA